MCGTESRGEREDAKESKRKEREGEKRSERETDILNLPCSVSLFPTSQVINEVG